MEHLAPGLAVGGAELQAYQQQRPPATEAS